MKLATTALLAGLLLPCTLATAATEPTDPAKTTPATPPVADNTKQPDFTFNPTMKAIGDSMALLFPVLFRDDEFRAAVNKAKIRKSINEILVLLKDAAPHFRERTLAFDTSYEVLLEHLEESSQAFESGNLNYTQNLLKEAVSICTSCHTQDSKGRTLFAGISRNSFERDFEYAEFSFMTRNYTDAIEYYGRFLEAPHKRYTENELLTALKREITIFAQIYNDPGKGADQLQSYLKKNTLTPYVVKTASEWIEGLRELESSDVFIENKQDFASLEKLVHHYLGPLDKPGVGIVTTKKEKVFHVWLRGLLYRYLNKNPTQDEIPKILYWLSINDRATNYSYYYSLADLYLQECMLIYTSHPYAKRCYAEYLEYVEFSYSGSLGTDIPEDVRQELKALHKKVFGDH